MVDKRRKFINYKNIPAFFLNVCMYDEDLHRCFWNNQIIFLYKSHNRWYRVARRYGIEGALIDDETGGILVSYNTLDVFRWVEEMKNEKG